MKQTLSVAKFVSFNTCDAHIIIATDYGLDGPGSNPGEDEIFRPSRPALGAHPASCTMGNGSFPGVEAVGAGGWPPPPSSAEGPRKDQSYTSAHP